MTAALGLAAAGGRLPGRLTTRHSVRAGGGFASVASPWRRSIARSTSGGLARWSGPGLLAAPAPWWLCRRRGFLLDRRRLLWWLSRTGRWPASLRGWLVARLNSSPRLLLALRWGRALPLRGLSLCGLALCGLLLYGLSSCGSLLGRLSSVLRSLLGLWLAPTPELLPTLLAGLTVDGRPSWFGLALCRGLSASLLSLRAVILVHSNQRAEARCPKIPASRAKTRETVVPATAAKRRLTPAKAFCPRRPQNLPWPA